MKTFLQIFIFVANLAMLVLAIKWYAETKEKEPLIVIVGQLSVLVSGCYLAIGNRNVKFSRLKRATITVTHKGPGNINMEDHEDTDINYQQ